MKEVKDLVRPCIRNMKPYSSARDEFQGEASVFLDANENPYNKPYNRYPDPLQRQLKKRISEIKGVDPASIFLGNGSDEAIDLIIRAFCEPATDNILSIDPSYGMYEVAANVNNVPFRKVKLDKNFDLDAGKLLQEVDENTKVISLCSPNNPSGNNLNRQQIHKVLDQFQGIVVIDEAYIDFSSLPSFTTELRRYPHLVILQTLSKAWGAAAIRLGMAFASPEIIGILNKIKYPYNVSQPSQEKALEILSDTAPFKKQVARILSERNTLESTMHQIPCVEDIYPSDANFILIKVADANATYDFLVKEGIIVRNRTNVTLCEDCLRITIGTPKENNKLIEALNKMPV
ncbi:MAG: histidinol-phosphate transaminase [Tannerellaceae bacterium]|nr:histidinol-phosphate transaminase [Tannerellaceae bacterium]